MDQLTNRQMALFLFCFLSGSSIVNIPNPIINASGNSAPLSVMLANASGMVILGIILYLDRKFPGLSYFDYCQKIAGKYAASVIFILLLMVILINNTYIILDIGSFFSSTMMKTTPPFVIHFLFLLVASLTARAGIVAIIRMFAVLLVIMLGFVLITLILVTPSYHLEYLMPLLPDGVKSIFHGAYIHYGFPYSELVYFAMILRYVQRDGKRSLGKWMYGTLFFYGFLIIVVITCTIMAIGPLAGTAKFSVFTIARLISVQEIFERIEAIIGMALIVGSYMKSTIMLFFLTETIARLTNSQHARNYAIPLAFLVLLFTMTMFRNESEFTQAVLVTWPFVTTTFAVVPLLLVTAVSLFKKS